MKVKPKKLSPDCNLENVSREFIVKMINQIGKLIDYEYKGELKDKKEVAQDYIDLFVDIVKKLFKGKKHRKISDDEVALFRYLARRKTRMVKKEERTIEIQKEYLEDKIERIERKIDEITDLLKYHIDLINELLNADEEGEE